MCWIIKETGFKKDKIELNGSKFLIGNGYMGYRGILEEYTKKELMACTLAGLFDKQREGWREPVNAPNGMFTRIYCDNELVSLLNTDAEEHEQFLNIEYGVHGRRSVFITSKGNRVTITAERFVSIDDLHLLAARYSIKTEKDTAP